MQGGGDAILIPSRFEPCGLTQLYGLRYGCVPVVARTGGLADTVIDANEAALTAGVATGFQFAPANADAFLPAHPPRRRAACATGRPGPSLQRQGMKADVSWDRSAAALRRPLHVPAFEEAGTGMIRTVATKPYRRPEARHLGPAQEGAGLPAAELCRELHPVDLRLPRGLRGQDAGDRRRRPLLQPRGHPDRASRMAAANGFGKVHRRAGRHPVDAGRLPRHPQVQGLRRHHPVGQPQSRRPARGFRHQVQYRQRRPGAGEDHRRDLRAHQGDRRATRSPTSARSTSTRSAPSRPAT